jgi:hypothetical protein
VLAIAIVLWPYAWPPGSAPTATWSDLHHQHAPAVALLAASLRADGELPRWNREDFGGMPTVGDPQAGVYNPVYWLLALGPSLYGFGLAIIAYAAIGAGGFWLYARALGLSRAAAAGGAVVFTLGGNLLMRVVLLGHTVYEPFFVAPLVLWAMQRVAAQPRPGPIAGAALLLAFLAVALHPQILFYAAVVFAVIGATMVAAAPRRLAAAAALTASAMLAVALAAVHLFPVVALAGEFSRGRPEFFDPSAWQPPGLLDLRWFGDAVIARRVAPEQIEGEAHFFLGTVGLALAVLGIGGWSRGDPRRPIAAQHGALALALVLYAAGVGARAEALLGNALGFPPFRIPARTLLVLALPVAVLVALGLDAIETGTSGRRRVVGAAAAGVVAAILIGRGAATVHVATFVVAALAAGALAVTTRARAIRALALLGIVAALAVETGSVLAPCVRAVPAADVGRLPAGLTLPPDLTDAGRIAQLERDAYSPGLPQLAVRAARLETLGGFNSLIPWRFVLYASYAGGFDPFAERFDVQVPLSIPTAPQLFDLLGVTHLLWLRTDGTWRWQRQPAALPPAYLVPNPFVLAEATAVVADEIEALERLARLDPRRGVLLHGPAATAAIRAAGIGDSTALEPFRPVALAERTANHITLDVDLAHPAVLVLNEPYVPGWRATSDGEPIPVLRANVLFRACVLGPGSHRVRFEFAPDSWRIGRVVSGAALIIVTALLALAAVRGSSPRGGRSAAPAASGR